MTTYSMLPADQGYWIVAVSISGSPMFVEHSDGEASAALRVRALQQRAHDLERPDSLPAPVDYH
jgi:hypothetical protein